MTHLAWYWDAFWELSADREVGFNVGRIPFVAIDRYAERYRILDLDEFDRFRFIIRSMDAEFRTISSGATPQGVTPTDTDGVRGLLQRLAKRGSDED